MYIQSLITINISYLISSVKRKKTLLTARATQTMDRLTFLRRLQALRQPLFSVSDIAALLGKGRRYTHLYLHRMVAAGVVERVGRGRYCLLDAHPFAVASHLASPAYISFWSALQYYGATTQLPLTIFVANGARSGESPSLRVEGGAYRVRFVKLRPALMTGYERVSFGPHLGFMALPEKAIVDSLLVPGNAPLEDVFELVRDGEIDPAKLVEFTRLTGRRTLMQRVGYLLTKAGYDPTLDDLGVDDTTLDVVKLAGQRPSRGKVDPRWKVLGNVSLEVDTA